ncbi:ATPase [Bacteroides pyogenes]|uniref:ATPase n=1 Tax=Bacteroides pyogenes TaxID=310300 RepID=UPI003B4397D2
MILIADSGSTKTDWCAVDHEGIVKRIRTQGTNPFFQSEEEICEEIRQNLLPHLPERRLGHIHFYGAGCAFPDKIDVVKRALNAHLHVEGSIEVSSDMLAAARSLCGHRAGIACIMGTGSNSCYYDGTEIVQNVSPLGFILGDEGSAAVLGKLLVGNLLKNRMPAGMKEEFLNEFNLTPAEIIDRVYRRPFPNRFLASLSPFLARRIAVPEVHQLVLNSFKDFLKRNVMQYDRRNLPVHFTGSVAFYYKGVLEEAVQAMGMQMGQVLQSPMEGLIKFHRPVCLPLESSVSRV